MTQIRPLTAADREAWQRLWDGYLTFYESEISPEVTDYTFDRIINPAGEIRGALAFTDEGVAIGLVHWLTHPATWTKARYCYLEDLFVDPAARGTGAGRALIEHVEGWASENGCDKVYWLTAESNTTAQLLYDRVATRTGFIHYQKRLG